VTAYTQSLSATLGFRATPLTYPDAALAYSPSAYWRMGESSGTLADSSGNSRTLTATGSPTYGVAGLLAGDSNTAIAFGPSATYFSRTDTTLARYTAAWSVACLIKPDGTTFDEGGIVCSNYDGSVVPWAIRTEAGTRKVQAAFYTGGSWYVAQIPSDLTGGQIYHVAGTWDGTTLRIYIDGALAASNAPGASVSGPTNTLVYVGRRWENDIGFPGTIDEVSIYPTTLTGSQIAALYSATVPELKGLSKRTARKVSATLNSAGTRAGTKRRNQALSAALGFAGTLARGFRLSSPGSFDVDLDGSTAGSGGGGPVSSGSSSTPHMASVSFTGKSVITVPPIDIGEALIQVSSGVTVAIPSPAIVSGLPLVPDVWVKPDSNMSINVGPAGIRVVPDPDPIDPDNPAPGGVAASYTWSVNTLTTPVAANSYQLLSWPTTTGSGPSWKSSTAFAPRVARHIHYGPNGKYRTYSKGVHFNANDIEHMWLDWGSGLAQPFTVLVCGILHDYPFRTYGHYVLDAGKPTSSTLADGQDHTIDDGLAYRSLMLYQSRTSILASHTGADAVRNGKHVIARNNFVPRPRMMFGLFNGSSSYIGAWDVRNKFIKRGTIDVKTHRYFVMGRRTDAVSDNLGAFMTVFEIRMFTSALTGDQLRAHYKQLASTWKFNLYHV